MKSGGWGWWSAYPSTGSASSFAQSGSACNAVRHIEAKLAECPKPDQMGTPDIPLMLSEGLVVFDSLSGRIYITVCLDPDAGDTLANEQARIDELMGQLQRGAPRDPEAGSPGCGRQTPPPASARLGSRPPSSASKRIRISKQWWVHSPY